MSRFSMFLTATLLVVLTGCGGGSAVSTNPDDALNPRDGQEAVAISGDIASVHIAAEGLLSPMMGGLEERPDRGAFACRTIEGDRMTGGSITFDDCDGPRGTMSGTITWTVDGDTRTTVRDLTFTRELDGAVLHITGTHTWTMTLLDGVATIHEVGSSTTTQGTRRVESESDLTWTRSRDSRDRGYPTGTIHTTFYDGTTVVREVLLTFDGTNTVTALVNGDTYTYQIDGPRPGRRPLPGPQRVAPR